MSDKTRKGRKRSVRAGPAVAADPLISSPVQSPVAIRARQLFVLFVSRLLPVVTFSFMTTDADNKSCKSSESSLKRNSDHLDARPSDQPADSTAADDQVVGDAESSPTSKPGASIDDHSAEATATAASGVVDNLSELTDFTVVFMKEKYEISLPSSHTVASLKQLLEQKVGVPAAAQKLLFKGLPREEMSLSEWGLKSGSKVILMGTRLADLINVQVPANQKVEESKPESGPSAKEPLCRQKPHAKVIEKGKPADAIAAIKGVRARLPLEPLSGMTNKSGGKVRLTFKLEADQLWIGTKERTEKVSMTSIRAVVSEPIEGHEEYHMVGIQLGPTEASRYWIYWVPAQYVDAIRETILGV